MSFCGRAWSRKETQEKDETKRRDKAFLKKHIMQI
jgi:hypothetical protein